MNRLLTLALAAVAASTLVATDLADARRMSGGRSLGAQRSAPAQQAQPQTPPSAAQAAPSGAAANPVMPRQGTAQTPATAAAAKAAPGAAAAAPKSGLGRWMGPLAGLAAGLGLAALASYLGIADELLSALLIAGLVVVAIVAIRALLARRAPARNAMQYAGAAAGGTSAPRSYGSSPPPAFEPAPAVAAATANVPPGFDVERFLLEAKHQFARLQGAHDRGDREALADVMTPALFAQVTGDLTATRGEHPTEIVALSADLVEVVTEGREHWASVRFRGLLREDGEPMPRPLDEVWHLVKPADGKSGWLLAGIQQGELAGHA